VHKRKKDIFHNWQLETPQVFVQTEYMRKVEVEPDLQDSYWYKRIKWSEKNESQSDDETLDQSL